MKLLLFEQESVDGYERHLDRTIRMARANDDEEEIKSVDLTEAEFRGLGSCASSPDALERELFAKFGITDLKSHPGCPKGPYYWIAPEVHRALGPIA